jgi:cation diffusion facilitator CzcD-associated flavoprotein CzcO
MTFKTEVVGCYWNQDKGEWLVKLKQTNADGSTKFFEDTCNLLLHGTGILNNFKWPVIEGMEKFKGKVRAKRILAQQKSLTRADHPHSEVAKGLSGRAMEKRQRRRDWLRSIVYSNRAKHATSCQAS